MGITRQHNVVPSKRRRLEDGADVGRLGLVADMIRYEREAFAADLGAERDHLAEVLHLMHATARPVERRRRARVPPVPHVTHVGGKEERPVLLQRVRATRRGDARWKELSVFVPTDSSLSRAVGVRGYERTGHERRTHGRSGRGAERHVGCRAYVRRPHSRVHPQVVIAKARSINLRSVRRHSNCRYTQPRRCLHLGEK
ncbi:hypothetical protein H257_08883 [Aphanomyces astaci]|uniref:Uncharacterized protein n=1 Tax=Aphanomyces astaci TaxID=112090 RepID=W4GES8_APHAT|nr:hypothetical protein H257_08883 [Aphanomyces astaci]ETV77473.1 hypothetical protein H257_08883 [Aphanomyces astaci]|eukprot:XP_009833260.1 hypothetical protein H257_08883 [Aphanomyces astaci]